MSRLMFKMLGGLLPIAGLLSGSAHALSLANSAIEFSNTQEQGNWQYGYYDANSVFQQMDWSTAQSSWVLPPGNPYALSLTGTGGQFSGILPSSAQPRAVRRWKSEYTGTINLKGSLDGTDVTGTILLDGAELFSLPITNSVSTTYDLDIQVEAGQVLDFVLSPDSSSLGNTFTFTSTIDPVLKKTLVFLDNDPNVASPEFEHVGLFAKNNVYESSPFYLNGTYLDVLANGPVAVIPDEGVQWEHTLGSFINLAQTYQQVEIDATLADKMAATIETRANDGYLTVNRFLTPEEHKGKNEAFTDIGLIEWAAEQAGFRGNQGFVNNHHESIKVLNIFGSGTAFHFEHSFSDCASGCISTLNAIPIVLGTSISNLTPQRLYDFATEYADKESNASLQGIFDNVDFLLTDPEGRRFGRLDNVFVEEIPDVDYTKIDTRQEFFIFDRLPGEYTLELFGTCADNTTALFGNAIAGTLVAGCDDKGRLPIGPILVPPGVPEDREPPEDIPEPRTILALALLGTAAVVWRRHQRFAQS